MKFECNANRTTCLVNEHGLLYIQYLMSLLKFWKLHLYTNACAQSLLDVMNITLMDNFYTKDYLSRKGINMEDCNCIFYGRLMNTFVNSVIVFPESLTYCRFTVAHYYPSIGYQYWMFILTPVYCCVMIKKPTLENFIITEYWYLKRRSARK